MRIDNKHQPIMINLGSRIKSKESN